MTSRTYYADQELPSLPFHWFDADGTVIDFSIGWTFTLEFITKKNGKLVHTKAAGITGAAALPNVVCTWTIGDLSAFTAGTYKVRLVARRTADSFDRVFMRDSLPELVVLPQPTV